MGIMNLNEQRREGARSHCHLMPVAKYNMPQSWPRGQQQLWGWQCVLLAACTIIRRWWGARRRDMRMPRSIAAKIAQVSFGTIHRPRRQTHMDVQYIRIHTMRASALCYNAQSRAEYSGDMGCDLLYDSRGKWRNQNLSARLRVTE